MVCGTLAEQANRLAQPEVRVPRLLPIRSPRHERPCAARHLPKRELILAKGLGGFPPDGREFVITTTPRLINP